MLRTINRSPWQQNKRDHKAASLWARRKLVRSINGWPLDEHGQQLEIIAQIAYETEDGEATSQQTYDMARFVNLMLESDFDLSEGEPLDFTNPNTIIGLIHDALDCSDDFVCFVGTRKMLEQQEAQEEMARLEEVAKAFARECGCNIGTMEFVTALFHATERARDELDNYNSYERQAEEWMDHRYCGIDMETTYDNIDYTRGQYSGRVRDLEGVRQWLESECPLLMAKVKESELESA